MIRATVDLLRALLFVPIFAAAFVLMLPSLIASRVPMHWWPAAVLYALLH